MSGEYQLDALIARAQADVQKALKRIIEDREVRRRVLERIRRDSETEHGEQLFHGRWHSPEHPPDDEDPDCP